MKPIYFNTCMQLQTIAYLIGQIQRTIKEVTKNIKYSYVANRHHPTET